MIVGPVNTKMKSFSKSYHRMIVQNRLLKEELQNYSELMRATSELIGTLQKEIKNLKAENEKCRAIADETSYSMIPSEQSPFPSMVKFCFWAVFFAYTLIPLFVK